MNRNIAKTLVAIALATAGFAQAAPAAVTAGQFSTNDMSLPSAQLYGGPAEVTATSVKTRVEARTEVLADQKAHQAGAFSANDMNLPLSQLYPGSEAAPASTVTVTRAEVMEEFRNARAAGELRSTDSGLTDKELFPQQYAGKPAVRAH